MRFSRIRFLGCTRFRARAAVSSVHFTESLILRGVQPGMEGKGTQTGYLTDRSNRGEIRILHTESYSIQYRLILMTENSPVLSTPILYDVELEWVPYTYIEEEGSYLDFELVGAFDTESIVLPNDNPAD